MSNRVLLVIAGAVLLLVGLILLARDAPPPPTEPASNNAYGNPDAKVVLIEAYSLACNACGSYHPGLKTIREEYKDRILFQVVHYTLSGTSRSGGLPNARAAHRAVEAAGRQGKFWEMHDVLFEQQGIWTAGATADPLPQIRAFAETDVGLDMAQFDEDFASEEINQIIRTDERYLKGLGVTETPTFFINGEMIESRLLFGAEAARQTLDAALEQAEAESQAVTEPASAHVVGESELGILVTEAYSLGCFGCAQHQEHLEQLQDEYSDRVRFQAVHYPLGDKFPNAPQAHRAIEAAGRQNKFWQLRSLLFERRDDWLQLPPDEFDSLLESLAEEVELNLEQFRNDLEDPAIDDIIAGDESYLESLGVAGTPSFFLNGQLSNGFADLESGRQTLDEALDEAANSRQ